MALSFAEKLAALKAKQNVTRADIIAAQPIEVPAIIEHDIQHNAMEQVAEDSEVEFDESLITESILEDDEPELIVPGQQYEIEGKPIEVPITVTPDEPDAPGPRFRPSPSAKLTIPLTQLEKDIDADRKVGQKAIDALESEAIFSENQYLADQFKDTDKKEQFKKIFTQVVQQSCLGKTIDEIDEMLREHHEMLFDTRSGIQALFAFRKELLKDVTADERAKRLKDDWLHKPSKRAVTEGRAKPKVKTERSVSSTDEPKARKQKFTMFETMRNGLMTMKGMTKEEAEARLKAKGIEP